MADGLNSTLSDDGTFDGTPINSMDENESSTLSNSEHSHTVSSDLDTSESGGDEDISAFEDQLYRDNRRQPSSSYEDDELRVANTSTSEWDKALKKGRPSKGNAGAFFAEQPAGQNPDLPPYLKTAQSQTAIVPSGHPRPMSQNGMMRPHPADSDDLSSGVLPDVLMTMRQKIESLSLFDSHMMKLADHQLESSETRESLIRSSQQSISAVILNGLAHKKYERRRIAALELGRTVQGLVKAGEFPRVRAILLLLGDDYVRSTGQDARKGGVVALAACALGLQEAPEGKAVSECRDLILASVVHACQDHSARVRYYAAESLFNVIKNIPSVAIEHFFILFEILRSLYDDADVNVREGALRVDKELKAKVLDAMNANKFRTEDCVPVFAKFISIHNKATSRLTLSWLQELNEKLDGSHPILQYLHLFLGGIFDMVAEADTVIRESAFAFLQYVLPRLLTANKPVNGKIAEVDFDKVLQSLVTTMEHPDPFVRKVAMYWMCRIVKAHMSPRSDGKRAASGSEAMEVDPASVSVRNSLPHVLPGVLLSIGDEFVSSQTASDPLLPKESTRSLAEQTNTCLQDAVRRDGSVYVQHLDGFIVALREELDTPGGIGSRNPPAVLRNTFRVEVRKDGSGIESAGWFRSNDKVRNEEGMILSRLCALHWVIVLYESVVPHLLKPDYAREFIFAIIQQLSDKPPKTIVFKSLEVLARITVPVAGEQVPKGSSGSLSALGIPDDPAASFPMTTASISFALDILDSDRRPLVSRDREVFSSLIQLYSVNGHLLGDLAGVVTYMCRLQPPEFVIVSFAIEIERFVQDRETMSAGKASGSSLSKELKYISAFVQQLVHVVLTADVTTPLRDLLKDCIGRKGNTEKDQQRSRIFHILLHSFAHNLTASLSLCFWSGAYRTAFLFLQQVETLDIDLIMLLEIDKLIEMLERPLFRHLHIRMLEPDRDNTAEGSGAMIFSTLKCLLMIIPQSTCYHVLKDRLTSASRYRQSTPMPSRFTREEGDTEVYVNRVVQVRQIHRAATWQSIREESLEVLRAKENKREVEHEEGSDRRRWLGYNSKHEESQAKLRFANEKQSRGKSFAKQTTDGYHDLDGMTPKAENELSPNKHPEPGSSESWRHFWDTE